MVPLTRSLCAALAPVAALLVAVGGCVLLAQDTHSRVVVAVVDAAGNPVTGLQASDFVLSSGKTPQRIVRASPLSDPVSALVLLDMSGSAIESYSFLEAGASALMQQFRPSDRIRFGRFAETVDLSSSLTDLRADMRAYVPLLPDLGRASAVWEAVAAGVTSLSPTRDSVIVVISDGVDSASRISPRNVERMAQAAGVAIYSIGFPMQLAQRTHDRTRELRNLSEKTGGAFFRVKTAAEVGAAAPKLAPELTHGRYALEFSSTFADGKHHELRVTVQRPQVIVHAPRMYLAPAATDRR